MRGRETYNLFEARDFGIERLVLCRVWGQMGALAVRNSTLMMKSWSFWDQKLKQKSSEMSVHEQNGSVLDKMLDMKCAAIEESMIRTHETKHARKQAQLGYGAVFEAHRLVYHSA